MSHFCIYLFIMPYGVELMALKLCSCSSKILKPEYFFLFIRHQEIYLPHVHVYPSLLNSVKLKSNIMVGFLKEMRNFSRFSL